MKLKLQAAAMLVAVAVGAAIGDAAAQAYPTKPIRIVMFAPTGGVSDLLARTVGQGLMEQMGQPFIVDPKPGGGGNIGAAEIARSAPDGYTIGFISIATHGINSALYGSKLPYDPMNDFEFLAVMAAYPNIVVVNPLVPANNMKELVAYAQANPGKLNFGSGGSGTSQHLAAEMFRMMAKIDMTHVPYRGSTQSIPALVAGEIQVMFVTLTDAISQVEAGRLRAIGMTTKERARIMPNVPTVAEQGYPDYDVPGWLGLGAPRGVPPEILNRLNREIYAALAKPEAKKRLADVGMETPPPMTPAQMRDFARSEIAKWTPVVKASGATAD